jgi:hypothetical protein
MVQDPGQTSPIQDQEPELASTLMAAIEAWRLDMFGTPSSEKRTGGGGAVDPRPIPVGFHEFPITQLPARDGTPVGTVRRSSNAPNCSYFVEWTSLDDRLEWLLDVETSGRYVVEVDYTCPESDIGSKVELSFQQARLVGKVDTSWDPPLYTNQDTLPRPPVESQMKEFRTLNLGTMELPKGQGSLTMRALEIPGESVMDVRRVTLTLLD